MFENELATGVVAGSGQNLRLKEPAPGRFSIPTGVYLYPALAHVLAKEEPFSGVVVHIAVNEVPGHERIPEEMSRFFANLLEAEDFGCQLAEDEFLIVSPHPDAASANRRLRSILERLWLFQLSGPSNFPVLFSWGAFEAREERLLDAATCATERMLQTKRQRQAVYIDSTARGYRAG